MRHINQNRIYDRTDYDSEPPFSKFVFAFIVFFLLYMGANLI